MLAAAGVHCRHAAAGPYAHMVHCWLEGLRCCLLLQGCSCRRFSASPCIYSMQDWCRGSKCCPLLLGSTCRRTRSPARLGHPEQTCLTGRARVLLVAAGLHKQLCERSHLPPLGAPPARPGTGQTPSLAPQSLWWSSLMMSVPGGHD